MDRQSKSSFFSRAGGAVWLLGLALVFVFAAFYIHRDFGVTWDERPHYEYGLAVADYFMSQGQIDKAAEHPAAARGKVLTYPGESGYGTIVDLPAELYARWRELDLKGFYEAKHLFISLWGLAGVIFAGLIAWRLGGPEAGVVAATLLLLCPRYFGHSFNNHKDIPFAAALTAVIWASLWALARVHRHGRLPWARLGLFLGVCLLTRQTGMVGPLFAAAGLLILFGGWTINRPLGPAERRHPEEIIFRLCLSFLVAYGCTLVLWPFIQQNPFEGPLAIWRMIAQREAAIPTLFEGRFISGPAVPRSYLVVWLWLTLPPVLILGLGLGLGRVGAEVAAGLKRWLAVLRRSGDRGEADEEVLALAGWAILAAWTIGLSFHLILNSAQLYDGVRLFLFIIPGLAVLAGLGWAWILRLVRARGKWAHRAAIVILGLAMMEPAAALIRLHPLQAVYFSPVVRGLKGVEGRFDLDYWGGSMALAARWLSAYIQNAEGRMLVRVTMPFDAAVVNLNEKLKPIPYERDQDEPADFFIGLRRWSMDRLFPEAPVIHWVRRAGVGLAVVKQLRPVEGLPWPPQETEP